MQVRNLLSGTGPENTLSNHVELSTLCWLGHVACNRHSSIIPCLIFRSSMKWKKPRGGQQVAWQRGMWKRIANLSKVSDSHLSGESPKDWSTRSLETLGVSETWTVAIVLSVCVEAEWSKFVFLHSKYIPSVVDCLVISFSLCIDSLPVVLAYSFFLSEHVTRWKRQRPLGASPVV